MTGNHWFNRCRFCPLYIYIYIYYRQECEKCRPSVYWQQRLAFYSKKNAPFMFIDWLHRNDENFLWAISVGWWYLLVRYLDFLDTFFFILRKKFTHVSRLHVIHHTIVAFNGSFWYLYAPEGQVQISFKQCFAEVVLWYSNIWNLAVSSNYNKGKYLLWS